MIWYMSLTFVLLIDMDMEQASCIRLTTLPHTSDVWQ
jgi:hypothetical protein